MLKEGVKVPSFSLFSDDGKEYSLSDFAGKSLVIFFYPKDLTPGCTQEACDFRDAQALLKKAKASVIGISRDSVKSHGKFREKYELNFPLLADESGEICEAFGVWQEKTLYGKKHMGIVRSTFIVDGNGKIAKIFSPVKVEGHVDAVLEALNEMKN